MSSALSVLNVNRFAHRQACNTLDWNCLGEKLASGADDSSIYIWSLDSKKRDRSCDEHRGPITKVSWNPNDNNVFLSTSKDNTLRLWDLRADKSSLVRSSDTFGYSCTWNPTSEKFAEVLDTLEIHIRDTRTMTNERILKFPSKIIEIEWSADGKYFFAASVTGKVFILDGNTLSINFADVIPLDAHPYTLSDIAVDRNGKLFATSSLDSTVNIWDSKDLINLYSLYNEEEIPHSLSFNSDGQYLASAYDNSVVIYSTETGESLYSRSTKDLKTVSWNPKKSILAYGGLDPTRHNEKGIVEIYDISLR